MTVRWAPMAVAAAAAVLAGWIWWPAEDVQAPVERDPVVEGVDQVADRARAELTPAEIERIEGDSAGGRVVAAEPSRPRTLTVRVAPGPYELPDDLRLELRFGSDPLEQVQRLRVGSNGVATWTAGAEGVWPDRVGFAFPTRRQSTVLVGDRERVVLPFPATCRLVFEVADVDGQPAADGGVLSVTAPWALQVRGKPRRVELAEGRAELLAEAVGESVQVEVITSTLRTARADLWTSRRAGERVPCRIELDTAGGVPFGVRDLPAAGAPWRVELFLRGGLNAVRAPRHGQGYLAFCRQAPGDEAGAFLDEDCFVVARGSSEPRWGSLRGRVAHMRPLAQVAAGRVVDDAGRGVEGVAVEVWPDADRPLLGARIASTRSAQDGSFVVQGPDPEVVAMVLHVPSTRRLVPLPHTGPLLLHASR